MKTIDPIHEELYSLIARLYPKDSSDQELLELIRIEIAGRTATQEEKSKLPHLVIAKYIELTILDEKYAFHAAQIPRIERGTGKFTPRYREPIEDFFEKQEETQEVIINTLEKCFIRDIFNSVSWAGLAELVNIIAPTTCVTSSRIICDSKGVVRFGTRPITCDCQKSLWKRYIQELAKKSMNQNVSEHINHRVTFATHKYDYTSDIETLAIPYVSLLDFSDTPNKLENAINKMQFVFCYDGIQQKPDESKNRYKKRLEGTAEKIEGKYFVIRRHIERTINNWIALHRNNPGFNRIYKKI